MGIERRRSEYIDKGGALIERYYKEGIDPTAMLLFGDASVWENGLTEHIVSDIGLLLENASDEVDEVIFVPLMSGSRERVIKPASIEYEVCHSFWYREERDWGALVISIPQYPNGFSEFMKPPEQRSNQLQADGRRFVVTYTPIGDNRNVLKVGNICVTRGEKSADEVLQRKMVDDGFRKTFCKEHEVPEEITREEIEGRIGLLKMVSRVQEIVDTGNALVGVGKRSEKKHEVEYRVPGRWVRHDEPKLIEVGVLPDKTKLYRTVRDEFVVATERELEEVRTAITEDDEKLMLEVMGNPEKDKVERCGGLLPCFLIWDVYGYRRFSDPKLASIAEKTMGIGIRTSQNISLEESQGLMSALKGV